MLNVVKCSSFGQCRKVNKHRYMNATVVSAFRSFHRRYLFVFKFLLFLTSFTPTSDLSLFSETADSKFAQNVSNNLVA